VKELLKLHNSHTDHATIQSDLENFIGVKMSRMQGPGCMVETGPKATVRDCCIVYPLQQFSSGSNCILELLKQVRIFDNSNWGAPVKWTGV